MRAGLALVLVIAMTLPAFAGSGPVIVIPGKPGVPIIINGIDASYAVVEGDWGLAKNVHVQPTVYGGHYVDPGPPVGHYYPSNGQLPGYGRLEIEPRTSRHYPRASQSYHQAWSAQSTPQSVQPEFPFYPPPVIHAPQDDAAGSPQGFSSPPQDFQHRKSRKFPH